MIKGTFRNEPYHCSSKYENRNFTIQDIVEIFDLYKMAPGYQRAKKIVVVWPEFNTD
jgi:hypothetical protein